MKIVAGGRFDQGDEIRDKLTELVNGEVPIAVDIVDHIDRDRQTKWKTIVSEFKPSGEQHG
jgi:hypothetical protein